MPVDDNQYSHDAGAFEDDYVPPQGPFLIDQEPMTSDLARDVGVYDSDVGCAGDESVALTISINETCRLAELQWVGAVESPESVYTYLSVRNRPFLSTSLRKPPWLVKS